MINSNRFCLLLLLLTLLCIIIGIFLVASSLRYMEHDDHEREVVSRRDVRDDGALHAAILVETNLQRVTREEEVSQKEPAPVFPEDYHASGLLILPHSSIAEPFEIWYSNTLGASRIDYYYGLDKTFQRGDEPLYGKYYKIVPMYNDKQGNFEGCWTIKGREKWPIFAQTIIPNITWFKYVKTEVYTGVLATKWHYEYWAYGMLNSQNVWVTKSKPHRPIRYEMKGYDSMLGSYYDHYVLEYISFEQWRPQMKRFEVPRDVPCFNWSLTLEASLVANPMQEFTKFSAEHLVDTDEVFHEFKQNHGKSYDNKLEHRKRKNIFQHNMRYIRSMNRKNKQFKLKGNHFTDMSHDEVEGHVGSMTKFDTRNHAGMKPLHKHDPVYIGRAPTPPDVPEELDWRDYGAVSSVKGQGICGSCYTFSAAGAAEGANFLKTGNLVPISSQQILDCSWGSGNHGCKGGHYAAALSFLYLHGAATLDSYGKYLAQEGVCHFNDTLLASKIDAFAYVPSYNNSALKHAVAKFGPAAVSINVSPLSFKFYSHGIYYDEDCWSNETRHSALVVGYGKIKNGKEFWLVKNSWSDSWGEHGYIRVAMDNNMCGITESPVVALVNHISFQFPVKEPIISVDSDDKASMGRKVKAIKRHGTKGKAERVSNDTDKILDKINKELDKELQNGLPNGSAKSRKSHDNIKSKKRKNFKKTSKAESYVKNEKIKLDSDKMPNVLEGTKVSQNIQVEAIDDKETPKIEKNDVRKDIGSLGDMIGNVSVPSNGEGLNFDAMKPDATKNDQVNNLELSTPKDKSRGTMEDFKLPTFKGNVDQSKLPNAFSESSNNLKNELDAGSINEEKSAGIKTGALTQLGGAVPPAAVIEDEKIKKEMKKTKSYHAHDKGVDVTVQDGNGLHDIQISVSKVEGKDYVKKKEKKKRKVKKKKKKSNGKDKIYAFTDLKAKRSQNDNAERKPAGNMPVSKVKLRKVLKDTLRSLYDKIDTAMLKQAMLGKTEEKS